MRAAMLAARRPTMQRDERLLETAMPAQRRNCNEVRRSITQTASNMKYIIICCSLEVLLTVSCSRPSKGKPEEYFRLNPGTKWSYKIDVGKARPLYLLTRS